MDCRQHVGYPFDDGVAGIVYEILKRQAQLLKVCMTSYSIFTHFPSFVAFLMRYSRERSLLNGLLNQIKKENNVKIMSTEKYSTKL